MNIYDISKKAGVSIATVSRVLNNGEHVSEKTRKKVMSVVEQEGYFPNVFARGLNMNTMQIMGILYSDASDLYLANAVYHLEHYLRKRGYNSLLCCCGYEIDQRKKYINLMLSKKVDAIILAGSHFVEEYDADNDYIRMAAQHVPIGILSGFVSGENIACAYCNNTRAIFDTANYLFDLGSEQIIFIYNMMSDSIRCKISGLKEAYDARGLEYREKYAVYCPITEINAIEKYVKAIRKQFQFDAVICMDDLFAVAVLKYAQNEHISVPDQLRIMGYNNSILSQCTTPMISTVDNRTMELCEKLVEMLVDRLAGVDGPMEYSLQGKLICQGTT